MNLNAIQSLTAEEVEKGQLFLIDKQLHLTSFQVVKKFRWLLKKRFDLNKLKVGHAGTLDPLATGLLVVCVGKFTKNIHQYQAQIKEYTGHFTVGATTPSYDLETEVEKTYPTNHISEELIYETAKTFEGMISQKPPIYSAIKKDGKRLYEIAREGLTTEIKPREVQVHSFEITKIEMPKVSFKIICSKGTYIRSLAYDFGKSLNSGAYLSELRRTKIGEFSVEDAIEIDQMAENL
jgi:tRNA pseudouridine55 synthase